MLNNVEKAGFNPGLLRLWDRALVSPLSTLGAQVGVLLENSRVGIVMRVEVVTVIKKQGTGKKAEAKEPSSLLAKVDRNARIGQFVPFRTERFDAVM